MPMVGFQHNFDYHKDKIYDRILEAFSINVSTEKVVST